VILTDREIKIAVMHSRGVGASGLQGGQRRMGIRGGTDVAEFV
jgi:hypothetical protein